MVSLLLTLAKLPLTSKKVDTIGGGGIVRSGHLISQTEQSGLGAVNLHGIVCRHR